MRSASGHTVHQMHLGHWERHALLGLLFVLKKRKKNGDPVGQHGHLEAILRLKVFNEVLEGHVTLFKAQERAKGGEK